MVFKIKVGDEFKAFELSLANILEAEQRHGVKIYNSDFMPPISLGAMAKFALAGFAAEKVDISKVEAIEWLQSCDSQALGDAVVDAFKRLNGVEDAADAAPLSPTPPLSTGEKSDTSDSASSN